MVYQAMYIFPHYKQFSGNILLILNYCIYGCTSKSIHVHNRLVLAYLGMVVVRLTDHLDMIIADDWDVKPQTKLSQ